MSRLLLLAGIPLLLVLNAASCDVSVAPGGAGPLVDVKLRAGVSLDDPLGLFPDRLQASVRRVSPLITLDAAERDRLGATEMARWFRLELVPGTDVDRFVAELEELDFVEVAEQVPEPAPDPRPAGSDRTAGAGSETRWPAGAPGKTLGRGRGGGRGPTFWDRGDLQSLCPPSGAEGIETLTVHGCKC